MLDSVTIGDILTVFWIEVAVAVPLILWSMHAKRILSKSRFKRFFAIFGIGLVASCFPYGPLGLIMGAPAVLIGALATSWFLDKETESGTHGN